MIPKGTETHGCYGGAAVDSQGFNRLWTDIVQECCECSIGIALLPTGFQGVPKKCAEVLPFPELQIGKLRAIASDLLSEATKSCSVPDD